MIEKKHPKLSISQQCRLLSVPRSSFYYQPKAETADNLALMRVMDEQFLKTPFYGVLQMTRHLRNQGHEVNPKRIRRLLRQMGLMAIYQKPNTSKANPEHKVYPYLLKDLAITRANQVWATDVTYIPMQRGFLYLVAIMDWATRTVLAWRLSNTMDTRFCLEALDEALAKYGPPEIFNSDQGSQFTSLEFTDRLKRANIKISMDGKGRCIDNVFIERLWRSLKYECVYLHAWQGGAEARAGIGWWMSFYNTERPHSSLDGKTPFSVYAAGGPVDMMDNPGAALGLPTYPQAQQQQEQDKDLDLVA